METTLPGLEVTAMPSALSLTASHIGTQQLETRMAALETKLQVVPAELREMHNQYSQEQARTLGLLQAQIGSVPTLVRSLLAEAQPEQQRQLIALQANLQHQAEELSRSSGQVRGLSSDLRQFVGEVSQELKRVSESVDAKFGGYVTRSAMQEHVKHALTQQAEMLNQVIALQSEKEAGILQSFERQEKTLNGMKKLLHSNTNQIQDLGASVEKAESSLVQQKALAQDKLDGISDTVVDMREVVERLQEEAEAQKEDVLRQRAELKEEVRQLQSSLSEATAEGESRHIKLGRKHEASIQDLRLKVDDLLVEVRREMQEYKKSYDLDKYQQQQADIRDIRMLVLDQATKVNTGMASSLKEEKARSAQQPETGSNELVEKALKMHQMATQQQLEAQKMQMKSLEEKLSQTEGLNDIRAQMAAQREAFSTQMERSEAMLASKIEQAHAALRQQSGEFERKTAQMQMENALRQQEQTLRQRDDALRELTLAVAVGGGGARGGTSAAGRGTSATPRGTSTGGGGAVQVGAGERAVEVPQLLHVTAPNVPQGCDGSYELVHGQLPNGYPLWHRRGRDGDDRWLFSGLSGQWIIGDMVERNLDLHCDTGIAATMTKHLGTMPDGLSRGDWQRFDGSDWKEDMTILVTVGRRGVNKQPLSARGGRER
eukprot:TRINITY_DN38330_c0_g1_i5.p1 TRINITY_DN38330_c0_g1~~TRINITY_DN38330_c0_g1_i5.p1  ORF type:complete len:750 (-),score=218.33 TRINITY_DN38330_c0_g1_i5:752-2728(-)